MLFFCGFRAVWLVSDLGAAWRMRAITTTTSCQNRSFGHAMEFDDLPRRSLCPRNRGIAGPEAVVASTSVRTAVPREWLRRRASTSRLQLGSPSLVLEHLCGGSGIFQSMPPSSRAVLDVCGGSTGTIGDMAWTAQFIRSCSRGQCHVLSQNGCEQGPAVHHDAEQGSKPLPGKCPLGRR